MHDFVAVPHKLKNPVILIRMETLQQTGQYYTELQYYTVNYSQ